MPYKVWAVGEEVLAADFNDYLQEQVVPIFASTAARDAAIVAPFAGQHCFVTGLGMQEHSGSAWQSIIGRWGAFSVTTDTLSQFTFAHGFAVAPSVVLITGKTPTGGGGKSFGVAIIIAITATTFTAQVRNAIDGVGLASTAITGQFLALP
jgi:hypothetical protein